MYMAVAFALFIIGMLCCLLTGASLLIAFIAGFLLFLTAGILKGGSPKRLAKAALTGVRDSVVVIEIMLLIGAVAGLWRASGTITFFVYYGVRIITPPLFILAAFLLSCLISYALGSAFGVSGTVGIVFMALARSGGVNELITAGAVISGVYFGDRCAPASGCANLVAAATRTELYGNVRRMLKTGLLPVLICVGFYGVLSVLNPIAHIDNVLMQALADGFQLSPLCALPALLMLILPLLKIKAIYALSINVAVSFLCALFLQNMDVAQILSCAFAGFQPEGILRVSLSGGGVVSMVSAVGIIAVASTYGGIFQETAVLENVQGKLHILADKIGLFPAMLLSSIPVGGIFCNQTTAVLINRQLWEKIYAERGAQNTELASDLSNSVVTLIGLIPWTTASAVPLAMLGVGAVALPFCIFLYLIPVCYLFTKKHWFCVKEKREPNLAVCSPKT